jgi:hypothetical protein
VGFIANLRNLQSHKIVQQVRSPFPSPFDSTAQTTTTIATIRLSWPLDAWNIVEPAQLMMTLVMGLAS